MEQAEEAATIQEILTNVTRWDRLPTVSLTSKFARIGYPNDGVPWNANFVSDWTIGVNVSVPLWTSGRLTGNTLDRRGKSGAGARPGESGPGRRLARCRRDGGTAADRAGHLGGDRRARWRRRSGPTTIATLRFKEGISTQTELNDSRLQLEQAEANRAGRGA